MSLGIGGGIPSRKGILITCDIPTMQVIKFLDNQENGDLIIEHLDETHVFVQPMFMDKINQEVERLQKKNHYET
jgi:hypothetical protein